MPEVQTTVDYLSKKLVGLRLVNLWSDREKPLRQAGGITKFRKEIRDRKILSVKRRAKFIVIDIEGPKTIFIHQKLSGHLLYGKWKMLARRSLGEGGANRKWGAITRGPLKEDPENKYIRVVFGLSNNHQLAFSDLRRFGKMVLVKDNDVSNLPEIKNLGPEPLEVNLSQFKNLFTRKRGRIKQVLMDPFFIAGIGNIYADEILWYSGLHPLSRAENLSEKDLKIIFKNTVAILKKAIKLGGSSVDDYRMPSGEKGEYQNQTKAYQHESERCFKKDGGIIKRIKIGGRSAHFCPVHQKLK